MSTFKPGKRIVSKKFFDPNTKMMSEHAWEWAKKEGKMNIGEGDALWRTGLAYITWKEEAMKEGIIDCYRPFGGNYHFKKKTYQAMRHTGRYGEDDVSRDQILMSLAALKVNGDLVELDEIASKLPYRLSRKFKMTPDFWAWTKTLTCTKHIKLYVNICSFIQIFEKSLAFSVNFLIAKICGFKRNKYTNSEYSSKIHYALKEKWNSFQKSAARAYYQGFAFHLACWQYYTLPQDYNPVLKRILRRIMLAYCEKENYLCRILLGDKTVTWEEVDGYISQEGFRWEAYIDGSWPNYHNEKSEEWKKKYLKYNQMDRDCLITMWNKEIGHEQEEK